MRTGRAKDERQGFGVATVLHLTGVSYRNLDYWARTGLVRSSIRAAGGKGSRRVYAFQDLVALRLVKQLRAAGIPLQAIRRAVKFLQTHADAPLSRLALVADGKKILARTDDPAWMIEATGAGQVVISVDVAPIRRSLETSVAELSAVREVQLRVRGNNYRVVLTPDLEVGGFTITVPELPGCISEGDTIREARVMAREAIELWLDAARDVTAALPSRAS
jgi:predicted RNase H-like HicB family nuclease/DNA-binding transcriptional MerR regulator